MLKDKKIEYLREKYTEYYDSYRDKNITFYENPSIAKAEPFKIADNLYYVGDKKVCIHLIDSGDGLILIDSGYLGATHLLVDSIWRAGFDPKNVKWIIHSHGHSDHFGASDEFKSMYGTRLAISRVDADRLKNLNARYISPKSFPFAKIPEFDYEIEDGEIFELGNTKIRCLHTPGHTDGVLSFFFDVTSDGKKYLAGMFGGAGVNALRLTHLYFANSPDAPQKMLATIDKIISEPVSVHLGNHPGNNDTFGKREKQIKEGGNPFVDDKSWGDFLRGLRLKVEDIIKENEALDKKLDEMMLKES